jgi:CRP-like cAMP-binding protein
MPEAPDVGAIVQQIKTRIRHVEEQLKQHEKLADELERLRGALARLEGAVRTQVSGERRARRPTAKAGSSARNPATSSDGATVTRTAKRANAPARAARGQNKATVLEALKAGPMTASEVSKVTGVSAGTVSTMLTKMAKTGEVAKADRGYKLLS